MKLKTVLKAHSALGELVNLDRQDKLVLHSSVRIKLSGALRKTRPVSEDFQEEYNALVRKYGSAVLDKEGHETPGQFVVKEKSESYPEFVKQRDGALDAEVEISFTPLDNAELFGKSEDETKQNQIPLDLIEVLIEVGLLKE